MKVKDLPDDTIVEKVLLRIPDDIFTSNELIRLSAVPEQEVYIVGGVMGDFFISNQHPDVKGNRRVYPLMGAEDTIDEWDVIEVCKAKPIT